MSTPGREHHERWLTTRDQVVVLSCAGMGWMFAAAAVIGLFVDPHDWLKWLVLAALAILALNSYRIRVLSFTRDGLRGQFDSDNATRMPGSMTSTYNPSDAQSPVSPLLTSTPATADESTG